MPIKLNASVCLDMGGNPVTDDDCEVTKDFILNLATKLTLSPYGKAYLKGLYEMPPAIYGENAYIIQGKYISNNCSTETKEEKNAWYILAHLEKDKPLPVYKPMDDEITEIECEHLMYDIETWTMDAERDAENKFSLKVFEDFAKMHDVSLDKVLVCQDWVDEVLAPEVIDAKEKAKKRIRIIED
jgi:hypothetical protein